MLLEKEHLEVHTNIKAKGTHTNLLKKGILIGFKDMKLLNIGLMMELFQNGVKSENWKTN